jgi:hypothetical protein
LPPLSGNRPGVLNSEENEQTISGDRWLTAEKEKRDIAISDAFDFC